MAPSRRMVLLARREAPPPVRPPWTDEAAVGARCTGCGDCIAACPETILGRDGRGRPAVDFAAGSCTFCGACAAACGAAVFAPDRRPAFGHVAAIGAGCLAQAGVHCQSCGDACAEAAIRFRPRIGGPPLPDLAAALCSGCGACIGVCPAGAIAVAPRP